MRTARALISLAGLTSLEAGLWILHPSAALIAGGILLLGLGYALHQPTPTTTRRGG